MGDIDFKRHLSSGEEIEIDGDKLILKPLTVDDLPDFFKIMKAMSGMATENATVADIFKNMDDDGFNAIKKVIRKSLRKSYPNATDEELDTFGMKYSMLLLPKIMEINSAPMDRNESARAKLAELQKKDA
jgi:hypothetical protein